MISTVNEKEKKKKKRDEESEKMKKERKVGDCNEDAAKLSKLIDYEVSLWR